MRLKGVSEETSCNILVKAEQLNPGGSVKDRAALYLIKDAEERGQKHRPKWIISTSTIVPKLSWIGLVRPGGTIVEGTAGNTGLVCYAFIFLHCLGLHVVTYLKLIFCCAQALVWHIYAMLLAISV